VTRPRRERKPAACIALAATLAALAGCGGDGSDDADRTYSVDIERVAFAPLQRIAQPNTFALTVRNSGERAIADLVVTLRGFGDDASAADQSATMRDRWLVDAPPPGATTASDDAWAVGKLAPGATRTLRWGVTPVLAGRHKLDYAFGAGAGGGSVQREDGKPARGSLTVRVTAKPAFARVDPRTGRVERRE